MWKDSPLNQIGEIDPDNGEWTRVEETLDLSVGLEFQLGVDVKALKGALTFIGVASGSITFAFSNADSYAAGDTPATLALSKIYATIQISLHMSALFVFDFSFTVLDKKEIIIWESSSRRFRRQSKYDHLERNSPNANFVQASMDIVEDLSLASSLKEGNVDFSQGPSGWHARYLTFSGTQSFPTTHMNVSAHRRRRSDGAWHFQDSAVVVEDVPQCGRPTIAVTGSSELILGWSYLAPDAVPPFGYGIGFRRWDGGQWSTGLHGFDLDSDTVSSTPVFAVLPGTDQYVVAYLRIVMPRELLLDPSLGNVVGSEIFTAVVSASAINTPPQPSSRFTTNSVMESDPRLHATPSTVVLTYIRQSSGNDDSFEYAVLLARWNTGTAAFDVADEIAAGEYGGPVRYAASGSNEMLAFYQRDQFTEQYFAVYSCWSADTAAWSDPARLDLRSSSYIRNEVGTNCGSNAHITTLEQCAAAAVALGLSNVGAEAEAEDDDLIGCFYSSAGDLFFNSLGNPDHVSSSSSICVGVSHQSDVELIGGRSDGKVLAA